MPSLRQWTRLFSFKLNAQLVQWESSSSPLAHRVTASVAIAFAPPVTEMVQDVIDLLLQARAPYGAYERHTSYPEIRLRREAALPV
jgi:hypothetical protein